MTAPIPLFVVARIDEKGREVPVGLPFRTRWEAEQRARRLCEETGASYSVTPVEPKKEEP